MKQAKQRVIAIDYFRGLCILMVVINHAAVFSMPFAYMAGDGGLWTSAAEFFFLLSGITLGIVRGEKIISNFKITAVKMWRRAAGLYGLNLLITFLSLGLAAFVLPRDVSTSVLGSLPKGSATDLIFNTLTLKYCYGLASFLMFYAVFMLFAPFALYTLRTRFWSAVPLLSLSIYIVNAINLSHSLPASLSSYALWQLYFVVGLTISKFRIKIINVFCDFPKRILTLASMAIVGSAATVTAVSVLIDFNIYPWINKLANDSWFPVKLRNAYLHLWNLRPEFYELFRDNRFGYLRPIATLLVFAALYIIYQKYKEFLLARTGRFVNTMGSQTLWIFVAQAIAIPIIASIPLPRNLAINAVLTYILIVAMWAVAKRQNIKSWMGDYWAALKFSYSESKYNYIQKYQDDFNA